MRGLSALFASGLLVAAAALAPVAAADGSVFPMLTASIESAPRSEMSTRYGDLSDLLAPETDRSLDPVLASATDSIAHDRDRSRAQGGNAGRSASRLGCEPDPRDQIARGLRPVFDFRRTRPGDFYALIRSDAGELLSFEYQRGRGEVYRLDRDPSGGLVAKKEVAPLERRILQLGGVVKGSLFNCAGDLGGVDVDTTSGVDGEPNKQVIELVFLGTNRVKHVDVVRQTRIVGENGRHGTDDSRSTCVHLFQNGHKGLLSLHALHWRTLGTSCSVSDASVRFALTAYWTMARVCYAVPSAIASIKDVSVSTIYASGIRRRAQTDACAANALRNVQSIARIAENAQGRFAASVTNAVVIMDSLVIAVVGNTSSVLVNVSDGYVDGVAVAQFICVSFVTNAIAVHV